MATDRVGSPKRLVAWGLLAGGVLFFIGGSMHPSDDPPGLSVKEHLQLLYDDPKWYPSHALLLAGTALIAAALLALVRSNRLAVAPRAHSVARVASVAGILASGSMLLHLVAASEAGKIDAGESTPLTDVNLIIEMLVVPVFGLSIAALAVVGAWTKTIGNFLTAAFGVAGGIAYALAAATALFTDALNFLFPFSAGVALWSIAAAFGLLLRDRRRGGVAAGVQEPT